MFCIYFEFVPISTSVQILTLYAQFLSRSFKSVDSIRNYISAIKLGKLLHLYLDLEYSQFESFHFKLVLKGLSRLNPHCPNQAQPITLYMLCDMFKHFDMSSPIDATVWCLFLHAFSIPVLRRAVLCDMAGGGRAGVHTGFSKITLVLYIVSLPNLAT